jgi:hypothetical protein
LDPDPASTAELIDSVRLDLSDASGRSTPTAVRIVWTGDYLDAVRRVQSQIVAPDTSSPSTAARAATAG